MKSTKNAIVANANANRPAIACGRFSSDAQEAGDSFARQQASAARTIARWDLIPDGRTIFDRGKSGFKGEHLSLDADLGRFMDDLENGRIKPDSEGKMPVLVWEAVDRFSRMGGVRSTDLIRRIIDRGVALVFDESNMWIDASTIDDNWIMLSVLIQQAQAYSKRLQTRLLSAWEGKRERIAEGKRERHSCPRWLRFDEATSAYVFNEQAETVRSAALLSIDGFSCGEIRSKLGLTGFKGKSSWQGLHNILRQRSLIGEFQPEKGRNAKREEAGAPVAGYYPALLTETEFLQVQTALDARRPGSPDQQKSKRGERVACLFSGLLFDAIDGSKLVVRPERNDKVGLQNENAFRGIPGSVSRRIDNAEVEAALLSFFVRLSPADVSRGKATSEGTETLDKAIADNLTLEKELTALLTETKDRSWLAQIVACKAERKELERKRDQVQRTAASLERDTLEQGKSIVEEMSAKTGAELLEYRMRLKSLLPTIIERVEVRIFDKTSAEYTVSLKSGIVRTLGVANGGADLTLLDEQE